MPKSPRNRGARPVRTHGIASRTPWQTFHTWFLLRDSVPLWQNRWLTMLRRLNYRLLIPLLLIAVSATVQIMRERRPSFLRPGLRLYAFVGNAGDGTVSVVDLIRVSKIATIAVGPSPSGLRAHPKFNQVWGVSTEGGLRVRHRLSHRPGSGAHSRRPVAFRFGFFAGRKPRLRGRFGVGNARGH